MSGSTIKLGVWKYEEPDPSLEITRDDLYYEEGNPPVEITKRDPKDTYNQVWVKWTDLSKESGYSFAVAKDPVDQRITGTVREKTYDLLGITTSELAVKTAYRFLAESMYRYDMYRFTLSYRTMVIEVGDVRYLSDDFGLDKQPILITRINEDANSGRMVIEAVENKRFLYLPFDDDYEFDQNYSENQHERQEPIDADDLAEPNLYFTESQQDSFINIHICPQDEDFNGFVLHYSFDDETYNYLGDCTIDNLSCNVDGTILSNLISYPVVMRRPKDAFGLEQNISFINLQSANDIQFFNKQSLLKIENEILAFRDVTEVGANFRVSNLIRGLFNTKPIEHASGVSWHSLKIDYKFKFNMEDVGKTIYFKALTHYGDKMIQLEDATPTSYVISGQYMKPLPVSLMRINGREGLSTYKTNDVILDWYFCSKSSGFGRGGYGNALWGNYTKDPLLERLKVEFEEEDGTSITNVIFDLDDYGEPVQLEILEADRNGKNPIRVKITSGSNLWSNETRNILIEKI